MSAARPPRPASNARAREPQPSPGAALDALLAALVPALAEQVADLVAARLAVTGGVGASRSPWLTVSEAAEHMRTKPRRLYDLVGRSRLRAHRDGSRLLFRREELDAYLEGADTLLTPGSDGPQNGAGRGAGRISNPQVARPPHPETG